MRPLSEIFLYAPRVEHFLSDHMDYLAHIPDEEERGKRPDEPLFEHTGKVLDYAHKICEAHQLEATIDKLLAAAAQPFVNQEAVADFLKEAFVGTIAFHDFGKINPWFQKDRVQNNLFQGNFPELIKPRHGHAALGTYLFLSHFLNQVTASPDFTGEEKKWLVGALASLSISIIEHHKSRLGKPELRVFKAIFDQKWAKWGGFLEKYGFNLPNVLGRLGEKPDIFFGEVGKRENFPLFALARLNFSLLTGADNLATSDYMKQGSMDDFGIIDEKLRADICKAARQTEAYNTDAFRNAEENSGWRPTDCTSGKRPGDDLNCLRSRMTVEVIREVRQTVQEKPGQRLFYLEAPTGGGKTNLSLLAAAELLRLCPEANKIIYVFPFTTLITQTHRVISKVYGLPEHEIGLLHGKSGFQERDKSREGEEPTANYGKDWKNDLHLQFAQFPVCLMTHIRFFDLLKSQSKSAIYPMHRLANAVVVLDELQSYPPLHWDKMLYFIEQYSCFFNVRFVLMSATLPRIDKLDLPLSVRPKFCDLLPDAREKYFLNKNFQKRVEFNFELLRNPEKPAGKRQIELPELADKVLEKSKTYARKNGGRVFTMIEFIFKKSATAFKLEIENEAREPFFEKIFVLSGTILEPRRREIINFLKQNADSKLKILLVTTQVVEAGVDIDMDLGFKNISLIDSDEQLAGRINRNVKKGVCEVYLFKTNEETMLYKQDLRLKVTRDNLSLDDHEQILRDKDFGRLYEKVLKKLDAYNQMEQLDTFEKDYLKNSLNPLDFKAVDQKFKLIDSDNLSIFVPLDLSIEIEGEKPGTAERIFDDPELDFLEKNNAWEKGSETVSGERVWKLFRSFLKAERDMEFFDKRVGKRKLQGILAKFTFSIFSTPAIREKLDTWVSDDSLEDYFCLNRNFHQIYEYQSGLMESELGKDFDNRAF